MTAIVDSPFARVGKDTIIRAGTDPNALMANDIAYSETLTIKEKIDNDLIWPVWPQGIQWPNGDKWDVGNPWPTWPQGIQGIQWPIWPTGATWPQGIKWDTWNTWPQWPQWIQGIQGLPWTWDMSKSENLSGLANYTTARSNLWLGSLATQSGTFTDKANLNGGNSFWGAQAFTDSKVTFGTNVTSNYQRLQVLGNSDSQRMIDWGDGGSVWSGFGRTTGNVMYMDTANYGGNEFEMRGKYKYMRELRYDNITDQWATALKIGSRYHISGIAHNSTGHIIQQVWWNATSTPEGSGNDGWWGYLFGSVWNPYIKMIAETTQIGRSDGDVFQRWNTWFTNGNIYRQGHNLGHLVWGYDNIGSSHTKTNPIYSIGDAYRPNDATLWDMYGIGYSHINASFVSDVSWGWGMYVAAAGAVNTWIAWEANGTSYFNWPITINNNRVVSSTWGNAYYVNYLTAAAYAALGTKDANTLYFTY